MLCRSCHVNILLVHVGANYLIYPLYGNFMMYSILEHSVTRWLIAAASAAQATARHTHEPGSHGDR